MYAIIETGGKQFRVEEGTKILVDRMAADVNSEVDVYKRQVQAGKASGGEPGEQGQPPRMFSRAFAPPVV